MRKIYILPNLVTTANMLCGFASVTYSVQGEYLHAAWAIVVAGFFDVLDGRVARMAKATSAFGVEYDSLSDLISFGVAPGLLLYQLGLVELGRLGWFCSFLFVVCGGLRLARFNVTTQKLPKGYFQGLPIPMAAGMVSTFVIFYDAIGAAQGGLPSPWFFASYGVALALLMVSTLPFPSFKEVHWRSRTSYPLFAAAILSVVAIAVKPEISFFLLGVTYLGSALIWNLTLFWRPEHRERVLRAPVESAAECAEVVG